MHEICQKCKAPLAIEGDLDWLILVTDFPANLGGCWLILSMGPGTVPCSRCNHINQFDAPHLVRGPNSQDILYLPDRGIGKPDPTDELILRAVARARNGADRSTLVVTHDKRDFRRAFLTRFVEPSAALLNRYAVEAQHKLEWIKAHENELRAPFFGGAWLLASGAMPIYTTSGSQAPATSFVPHESAPDTASHVIARSQAEAVTSERTGELLGWLLAVWALRALEMRSMQQARDASSPLLSPAVLTEHVLSSAASVTRSLVSQIKQSERGATAWEYALEAVLALFCYLNDRPNPRRSEWTTMQLVYDYARRIDGNDESILLDPSLVRSSIDEPLFWQTYEKIGRELGFGQITEENKPRIMAFMDTAGRLYPEETPNLWKFEWHPSQELNDDEVLVEARASLKDAVDRLPSMFMLESILAGLALRRRSLLVPITKDLTLALDNRPSLSIADRARVLRKTIETLNHSEYFEAAVVVAQKLTSLLDTKGAEKLPSSERGYHFNEIGNCLRYTGQLEAALALYERSLDLVGHDPKDANARVGLRNRAIILRDLHRYSEARSAFAALKPFAHDAELRGIVVSEALCLHEMGLVAPALALLEENTPLISGRSMKALHVLEYGTLLAALSLERGKIDAAVALTPGLAESGEQRGYVLARATAARIEIATALRNPDRGARDAALKDPIAKLSEIVNEFIGHSTLPTAALGALEELNLALLAVGRGDEAEALIRHVVDHISPEGTPKGWLLYLLVAQHRMRRSRREEALSEVMGALKYLDRALWEVTTNEDVLAVFSPHAGAASELVQLGFDLTRGQQKAFGALLRFAADLRATPVLSARLRRRVGLPCAGEDIAAEERRLQRLLQRTPATIVQFVSIGDDVAILRTSLNDGGRVVTESRLLGLTPQALRKAAGQLRLTLSSSDPAALALDLTRVHGWDELVSRLHTSIDGIPSNLPLCVAGARSMR